MRTWEVQNAIGTLLCTFDSADLARAWARRQSATLGPLTVYEVEKIEVRRRLWTARAPARAAA